MINGVHHQNQFIHHFLNPNPHLFLFQPIKPLFFTIKKMIMRFTILLLLLLITCTSKGQNLFSGKLLDKESNHPIIYANIGIVGKNVGTVSNLNGDFELKLSDEYKDDTLKITAIGFKDMIHRVSSFKKLFSENQTIRMEQQVVELNEIVVSGKELKEVTLGNKTASKFMSLGFSSNDLGNELGIKVKIKKSPTHIKSFNTTIAENGYDSLKFRINFYQIKKNNPDKKIPTKDIIVVTKIKNGQLSFDLTDYNIVVYDDFYVTLEWIEDLGGDDLKFSASRFGNHIVTRMTSQGNWEKISIVSIGFNVTALH